jgi:hypothetical protein
MASNVKVNIDVNAGSVTFAGDKVLTLTQQVRLLKQELQKVPEGTAEWTLLQQKFNETKDNLDRVNVKSKELFGTFSSLPGPIGAVAGQLDNTVGVLKTFSSLKFSDIKTQFVELGKDLGGVLSNIGKLTGITALYTTLNNALASSFVKIGIGETAAAAGARAFAGALTATGVGAIVVAIGFLVDKLITVATNFFDATKEAKAFTAALDDQNKKAKERAQAIKTDGDLAIATLKKYGATEEQIRNQQIENARLLRRQAQSDSIYAERTYLRALQLGNDDADKEAKEKARVNLVEKKDAAKQALAGLRTIQGEAISAEKKAAEEAAKTAADKAKQAAEERRKIREKELADIKKNAADAAMALLEGKDKELAEIDKKYKVQIDLAKKYGKDITVLEAAQKAERNRVIKKYDDEAEKQAYEFSKKLGEISVAAIEDETQQKIAARAEKYRQDLVDLEKDKEFIKLSEESKAFYRNQLKQAYDQDVQQINYDAAVKQLDDDLKLLDIRKGAVAEGTQAYFDVIREIEAKAYEKQLLEAKGQADKIEAINAQHAQNMQNIKMQEKIATINIEKEKFDTVLAGLDGLTKILFKSKDLAIASVVIQKAAAIGQIVASTGIANAKAVAASPLTLGQPWVAINTISGILSAAGVVAEAVTSINEIKNQGASLGVGSSGGSAGSSATPAFTGMSVSGPTIGATGAQQGTIAGIAAGSLAANNSQSQPIRAYVVGNDITSEMQLQRRIRTAARLGG